MIGKTLGYLQIVEKVSEGRMGVVHMALGTHLHSSIAIKVLPPRKVSHAILKRCFVQNCEGGLV